MSPATHPSPEGLSPQQGTGASPRPDLAIFSPTFNDGGGVSRVFVNLANGIAALGRRVTLILVRSDSAFLRQLAPSVEVVCLSKRRDRDLAGGLLQYLREHHPRAILTGHVRDDAIAALVKDRLDDPRVRFYCAVGTSLPEQARLNRRVRLAVLLYRRRFRRVLARFDGLVANSQAGAQELAEFLGLPRERIAVTPLPAVTPELGRLALERVDHPWIADRGIPVVAAAGRLARVKDFPTLLRAFALLRAERPCRLVLLGGGRQLGKLRKLARRLGVAEDLAFLGFVPNPYPYIAGARLLVVSSLREGGPNVLIEAMALGTPVVSTDCPSGPREILDGGRYGALVPRRDPRALAAAMAATLDSPLPAETLREGAARFSVERSALAHLRAFGL